MKSSSAGLRRRHWPSKAKPSNDDRFSRVEPLTDEGRATIPPFVVDETKHRLTLRHQGFDFLGLYGDGLHQIDVSRIGDEYVIL